MKGPILVQVQDTVGSTMNTPYFPGIVVDATRVEALEEHVYGDDERTTTIFMRGRRAMYAHAPMDEVLKRLADGVAKVVDLTK